jgi:hypothetical protein
MAQFRRGAQFLAAVEIPDDQTILAAQGLSGLPA